jgi:hypothetical protein
VWGNVDNYCSFVRLENQVQYGWDLLGRGFGWGDLVGTQGGWDSRYTAKRRLKVRLVVVKEA